MTLLENDIKLLAVQHLLEREALDKFCVELNQPTLASVRQWRGARGLWKSAVAEEPTRHCDKGVSYSGFLWDSSSGIDLKDAVVLESPIVNGNGKPAHPRPYLAHFLIGSSELTIINVHMAPPPSQAPLPGGNQHSLASSLQDTLRGEKDVLVMGDFGLPPQSPETEVLRKEKLTALVPYTQFTNISTRSPLGSLCLDNIWLSKNLKKIYSGHCMVVREGLTNPWIPDNWSWGGVASDHCPVVAEFFAEVASKGLGRNGVAVVERGDIMSKHER